LISSQATGVLPDSSYQPQQIVVATMQAAPSSSGGYSLGVIVNASATIWDTLDGDVNALHWWTHVAALVKSHTQGGALSVVGDVPFPLQKGLIHWQQTEVIRALYAERKSLNLPPYTRVVAAVNRSSTGANAAERPPFQDYASLESLQCGESQIHDIATPFDLDEGVAYLTSRADAQALTDVLRAQHQALAAAAQPYYTVRVDDKA